MDMIGKVRRMHRRGNKSERAISRMTGLSRNTVAKWLNEPLEGEPKYRRELQPDKLTAFHEALSRRRIWIDAGKQRFGSFVELNAWLGERCRLLWEELRHPSISSSAWPSCSSTSART
jgi:transposase